MDPEKKPVMNKSYSISPHHLNCLQWNRTNVYRVGRLILRNSFLTDVLRITNGVYSDRNHWVKEATLGPVPLDATLLFHRWGQRSEVPDNTELQFDDCDHCKGKLEIEPQDAKWLQPVWVFALKSAWRPYCKHNRSYATNIRMANVNDRILSTAWELAMLTMSSNYSPCTT